MVGRYKCKSTDCIFIWNTFIDELIGTAVYIDTMQYNIHIIFVNPILLKRNKNEQFHNGLVNL